MYCWQAVAKFCKDYTHTAPARRDCTFLIALPCKHTSRIRSLEALGCALTGHDICCYATRMFPTLWIYNTYSSGVACRMAYIALTIGAALLGFGTV